MFQKMKYYGYIIILNWFWIKNEEKQWLKAGMEMWMKKMERVDQVARFI